MIKKGAAHCPTNKAVRDCLQHFNVSDAAMDSKAADK